MSQRSAGHHAAAARHRRHFLYRLDHLGIDAVAFAFDGRGGAKEVRFAADKDGQQVKMPDALVTVPVTRLEVDAACGREVLRSGYLQLPFPDALRVWAHEFIGAELPTWRLGYGLAGRVSLHLTERRIAVALTA